MAEPAGASPRLLLFEPQPSQETEYLALFREAGYEARGAQPRDDVAAFCREFHPAIVAYDMAYWEADTALVFGILTEALGFERPIIVGICNLPFQLRRAKRFGADGIFRKGGAKIWGGPEIMPGQELAKLVGLCDELLAKRAAGELKPPPVKTPL